MWVSIWSSAIGYIIKQTTVSGQNINMIRLNKLWMSWKDVFHNNLKLLNCFPYFVKKAKRKTLISVSVRQFLISTTYLSLEKRTLFKFMSALTAADTLSYSTCILQTICTHKRLPRQTLLTIEPVISSLGIFVTMISWYYNIYGTEWGMLALSEKSHYYVTSNLYILPKIYSIIFWCQC